MHDLHRKLGLQEGSNHRGSMSVHEELLVSDFQQCFEQIRHYDEIFHRTLQFGFGGVVAVIAASGALAGQYGLTRLITTTVGLMLLVSSVAGFLLVASLARNRVYFAFVARYVNEVRALYLAQSPGSISNKAGIYTDPGFPKIFNPFSSHSFQLYFLSSCNSFLITGGVIALLVSRALATSGSPAVNWWAGLLAFSLSMLVQIGWVLLYWCHKERQKTAEAAVFGKKV